MMGEMVTVGCKAPNGLILNLDSYQRIGDSRDVQRVSGAQTVTLRGWAHGFGKPDMTEETGGYRLTQVPADFWEAWIKTHADSSLLRDRIIMPPPKKTGDHEATAQARDHEAVEKMHRPAQTDGKDPRAPGVPIATKED